MFKNKSLIGSYWELKNYDERLIFSSSQQNQISPLLAKLLLAIAEGKKKYDKSVRNFG